VQSITTATQVSAGGRHTCALLSSGHIECWGRNNRAQLGNGTTTSTDTPVEVQGIATATQVSAAGWAHSCALLSSGQIQCWGDNQEGQVGNGTAWSTLPTEVLGIP